MRKMLWVYGASLLLFTTSLHGQQSLWSQVNFSENSKQFSPSVPDTMATYVKIELAQLGKILGSAGLEIPGKKPVGGVRFLLPLPGGEALPAMVMESPIWDAAYADDFIHVKTFVVRNPLTQASLGRLCLTAEGISGILFTDNGDVYISPVTSNAPGTHKVSYIKDEKAAVFSCGSSANADYTMPLNKASKVNSVDANNRTYRLAIAATAEYTSWAGSQTNARNYITISVNNVMAIYERDLNIKFTIVAPNSILFTNAATDPYPGGNTYLDDVATNANQVTLDNIIGPAAYDVGMVFNKGWDRGYVPFPFGYVCTDGKKGKGASGTSTGQGLNPIPGPQGLAFDFTVAHEMGHQFGAPHSYASNTGTCTGFATPSAAFEPGSGSTIMGYAGYTNCNTYTNYGENYFHAGSIAQIKAYINGTGNCVQRVPTGNKQPVVTVAAISYNVPVSTPFALTGAGTDANGDALIYTWEQMDAGFLTTSPPAASNTGGPNFRSFAPTTTGNTRNFPRINDLAAGIATPYEVLPSVARTMHFRLTARDQSSLGGGTGEANVSVNFSGNAGPFAISSPQSPVTWAPYTTQVVTWNVATTNVAPINCTSVSILFSTDGGISYPYTLISNTTNDGSESIIVPNLSTGKGRLKVQATGNIFFNINTADITIASTCAAEGTTILPTDSIAVAAGSTLLNLSLSPQYGTAITPAGTITSANAATTLTMFNSGNGFCATYGFAGAYKYNTHPFTVTTSGSYTFTPSTYGLVYNLYRESFNPSFPCNNFIASNCVTGLTPTTINPSLTVTLLPGKYVLTAGTFSPTFPALPHTYNVTVSGGTIYSNTPNPGPSHSYYYVVVDKSSGLIKSITTTTDLRNSTMYPGGKVYSIYGLSYSNASPSLNSFVSTNFSSLADALLFNSTYCGSISKNFYTVTILTIYSFTGTGNWDIPANWTNAAIPVSPLPPYSEIVVDPVTGTECILNVPMIVPAGGKLTVQPGKTLRVQGNLTIQEL
ncbi:MAG: reprolysin-like metallopeptidase [Ferruginibacter sp.]